MTIINRNPETAESEHYDIIIIGGGIYGAMLLLEASQRNQRALLLEKQDFGAGTSYNSLRIIHGGLRYLQTLDFTRFWESVAERQWLLSTFPDLVKPMPCMMPLYNKGAKRPFVLRIALLLNDLLSSRRNKNVPAANAIHNGRILSVTETRQLFPGVINEALTGSALWFDAHAPDTQRVIMETLRWACSLGAQAFNYIEVTDILQSGNTVSGVQVSDKETGKTYEYRCNTVINATGPNGRKLSEHFDRDIPELYQPSLAWNIRFDCPTPCDYALALTPERPDAPTYFLHPWKGRLLVGMGHEPYKGEAGSHPAPSKKLIESFIDDMNLMMPDANLSMKNVEQIFSGYLPVTEEGGTKLTKRAVIYDHGSKDGPKGLYSITGIKFTTAHREAGRTLKLILGENNLNRKRRPNQTVTSEITCAGYDWIPEKDETSWKNDLKNLIKNESVLHIGDLIYRRTSIGDNPDRVKALVEEIANLFDWNDQRKQLEISALMNKETD